MHVFVILRYYLGKTYRPGLRQIIHKERLKTDKYLIGCGEVQSVLILR